MGDAFQFRDRVNDTAIDVRVDSTAPGVSGGVTIGIAAGDGGRAAVTLARHDARSLAGALVRAASPDPPPGDNKLTGAEFSQLVGLLHRFASTELDQFDHWSLSIPPYGEVYIDIHLGVTQPEWYTNLDGWLPEPRTG